MKQSFTIIPDVHGRPFWRDAVQDIETTPVIFLGDYLDPYPQDHVTWKDSWNGLKDIIELKRKHPEHVTLLLGNHDVHYLPGYPFFQKSSRYDDVHATRIENLFLKNLDCFDIAKIIPRLDGHPFLLTHAGVQNSWISQIYHELRMEDPAIHDFLLELSDIKGHPNQIANLFNRALHSQNTNLMKFIIRSLSSISPSRGGRQQGSCVWADFDELKQFEGNLLAGCIQIVGHTRQDSFNQLTFDTEERSNIFCVDYGRAFTLQPGKSPFLKFKNELKTSFAISDLAAAPNYFIFGLWLWNLTPEAKEQAETLIGKALKAGHLKIYEDNAFYTISEVLRFFREVNNEDIPDWVVAKWRQIKPFITTMDPKDLSATILGAKFVDKYYKIKDCNND